MITKSLVISCHKDLRHAAELLRTDENLGRNFFNSNVFLIYGNEISDKTSPLRSFFFIFNELDEYLNNPGARALGQGNLRNLLDASGIDLDTALNEALLRVTTQKPPLGGAL